MLIKFKISLNEEQKEAKQKILDNTLTLLAGRAGSGKTLLACQVALDGLIRRHYSKIIITRPTVSKEEIGFLPGDEQEKVSLYEAPYRSVCGELFGIKDAYDALKQQNNIKFMSTSFIRGITINNAVVIVDECQNLNFHELDSIITRIGKNSKIIFSGDYTQSDLTKENDKKGIQHFMRILKCLKEFTAIEFGIEDIVRSDFLKQYIIAKYNMQSNGNY